MNGLESIDQWPVDSASAGWVSADGTRFFLGDQDRPFALASVTKPLFALAVLVAVEEGSLSLEQPAGPPGATVAHLLSHSSGLGPDAPPSGLDAELPILARVGTKRIYSNLGFEILGQVLAAATEMSAAQYFEEAVVNPLGLTRTTLDGSPAYGASSTTKDLLTVTAELMRPTLISAQTLAKATTPFLESLDGVLPGFGRHEPNPWGLGFEIRGRKSPHWTGATNSPATFGHFGRAGTFLWIDPAAGIGCIGLSNRDFGPWAIDSWPQLSDDVLSAVKTSQI